MRSSACSIATCSRCSRNSTACGIDYAWSGLMSYARHQMPQIGRMEDGLWLAQAFGGHGVAPTTLAGEVIASAIAEGDHALAGVRRLRPGVGAEAGRFRGRAAELLVGRIQGRLEGLARASRVNELQNNDGARRRRRALPAARVTALRRCPPRPCRCRCTSSPCRTSAGGGAGRARSSRCAPRRSRPADGRARSRRRAD